MPPGFMANEGQGTRNTSSNSHTFSFDSPRLNDGCFSNRGGFDSNGFMFSSMGKTLLNSENLGLGRSTSRTSDGEFKYGCFSSTNSFSVGNTSFAKNTHTGRSKPRLTKLSKNPSTFKGKFPAENRGESSGLNPLKQTVGAEKFGVLSQPEETQSSISSGSYAFHNNDHHKAKSFGKANGTVESGSSEFVFKQDVESPYVESAPKPMFVPSVSAARLQEVSKQNPAMAGVVSEELEASLKSGMAEETNGNNVQSVLSSKFMPVQNDQSRSSIRDFLKENEELRTRIRNWRPYSDDKGMERPTWEFLFEGIAKEGSYAKGTNGGRANVPVNADGSTGNPKIPSFSFANNAFAPASTGNPTNAASSGTSIPLLFGEGAATNYCMSSEFLQEMKLRDHIKDWNPFGDGSKQRDSHSFKNDEHQNSRNSTRRGDHFEKFSSIEVPFAPEIRGGQVPDMNGKDVDPSCSKKVLEDKKVPFQQQSFVFTSTSQPKSMTKCRSKHNFHAGVHSNNSSQKTEGTCDPLLSSPTKCSDSNIAEENLGEKAKKFFHKADVSAIPETDSKGSVSSDNAFDIKTDNLNSSKFLFSDGKFGNSSESTFPCGSFKETCNAAPSDQYSCPGDTEKPHGEGTVFENEQANGGDSWPYMQSLSSSLDQVFEFHASNIPKQSSVSRKKKGKAHVPSFIRRKNVKPSTITKSKTRMTSPYPANRSEEGSPMDFSPYNETVINNESTFDSKGMSDGGQSSKTAFPFDDQETFYTTETPEMEAKVEELRAAASKLHIGTNNTGTFENNTEEQRPGGEKCQASSNVMQTEAAIHDDYSQNEDKYEEVSLPNSESEWFKSRMEQVKIKDNNTTETATFEKNNTNQQFTFAASFSKTASSSNRNRFRRRQRSNNVESLHVSDTPTKLESTASSFVFHVEVRQQDTERMDSKKFGKEGSYEVAERVSNVGSSSDASQETPENVDTASAMKLMCEETKKACEEWRCLGNQAYAIGDFPRAEDYYSKGANVVFPIETPQQCIRASMLCYSNRAATRMALGRWREALADCKRAMAIDPKFLRVQIRAASCHLGLGENEEAIIIFKECLRSAKEIDTLDLKIASEASEGLKRAEQGLEYCEHAAKLMNTKSAADMINALCMLTEALSLSPYSEQLLQMKVSSLLFLRRYDEAIQVCEQSLDFAEKNCATANLHNNQQIDDSNEGLAKAFSQLWRWHMCAKSHFYMGRLEEAQSLLVKYENVNLSLQRLGMKSTESLAVFMDKVHNLLQHKVAGNKAFQAGRHAEAVEHYTAALACGGDSRPFTAVCFCNRAAASQALGLIADAIADCSRAIALDPNYPKALSRRATLHEMVHDHAQSAADLQRLVYLLEKQKEEKLSGRLACSNTIARDLRQANDRLAKAQKEVKAMKPVNHYLILGVKASSSAAEIKKAYRKAALKYHPDKAGQSLLRGDEGDDGSWKEVEHQVCRDAERLFKMIGEAYAVLSDPEKRLCYDEEESNSFYYEKVNRKYGNQWEQWDNKYADPYYQRRKSPESARRFYRRRGSKFTDDWD